MADANVLNDFPDRLSPMLVKELRQGMRAKTFVSLFLALQVFLLLILLISFSAAGLANNEAGTTISGIVFLFYALAVLVVQPLRGMGALSGEIKSNTIDMMVLTRLDSWRIVGGKWVALLAQSALILVATMPYLVLRYFFGGMNLFAELTLLLLIFILSAGLCALTVGLSASGAIISRLLPIAGTIAMVFGIFGTCFDRSAMKELLEGLSMTTATQRYVILSMVLLTIYLAWLALSVGASQIAPMAENHSTRRRVIGLAMTIAAGLLAWRADFNSEAFIFLMLVVVGPILIVTLGEGQQLIPRHCQPFVKYGLLGRIAGRVLYPGWVCGVPFVILLLTITTVIFYLFHRHEKTLDSEDLLVSLSIINGLIFPRAVMVGWIHKVKQVLPMYLLIGVSSGLAGVIIYAMAESTKAPAVMAVFSWIPAVNLFWGMDRSSDRETAMAVGCACLALYLMLLLITALMRFHKVRSIEADAAA